MAIAEWFQDELDNAAASPGFMLEGLLWDFKERVATLLEERGLTRTELAERMGVSPAYVTKVLRGNRNVSLHTICKFAAALGQTAELRVCDPAARTPVASPRRTPQPSVASVSRRRRAGAGGS
jgi:transcriptional regulator with XRE-family HTH domain